jgi:hypothetical protein
MSYDAVEIKSRFDEGRFADLLESIGATVNRRSRRSSCPVHHGDNSEALSFKQNGSAVLWHCFRCSTGGSVVDLVMRCFGKNFEEALSWLGDYAGAPKSEPRSKAEAPPPRAPKVTRYEIRDTEGNLIAVHVRRDFEGGKKDFLWVRDGKTGLARLSPADLPLYGTERVNDWPRDEQPIFLCEGEKATDACLRHGLRALGTVTGASSTPAEGPLGVLAGRPVVLFADNDGTGKAHMGRIAEALLHAAVSVRIIALGDGIGDDAADYFEGGGTPENLVRTAMESPTMKPPRKRPSTRNREEAPPSLALPDSAWPGPLAEWRDFVSARTEAPIEFLWAAFMAAVSAAVGRSLFYSMPRPIYPNMYTLLTGPTGSARKSTVLGLATGLLGGIDSAVKVLRGISSAEGLGDFLAEEDGARCLLHLDELAILRTVADRKGTANVLPTLNTLYDCPPELSFPRRGEHSTRVLNPYLTVLAAAPTGSLSDLLGEQDAAAGTVNRFSVISGEETAPKPRPLPIRPSDLERIAGPVKATVERLRHGGTSEWILDDECGSIWDAFYLRWKKARKADPRAALTERTHVHAIKYAMLFGVICGEKNFTAPLLKAAIETAEVLEAGALKVLGAVGQTRIGRAQDAVLAAILRCRRSDGWAVTRKVRETLSPGKDRDGFRQSMTDLERGGVIETGSERTGSGQNQKLVRLIEGD